MGVWVGVQYCVKDSPSPREGRCLREKAQGSHSTLPVTLTDLESCGVEGLDSDNRGCFFHDIHKVPVAGIGEVALALSLAA